MIPKSLQRLCEWSAVPCYIRTSDGFNKVEIYLGDLASISITIYVNRWRRDVDITLSFVDDVHYETLCDIVSICDDIYSEYMEANGFREVVQ